MDFKLKDFSRHTPFFILGLGVLLPLLATLIWLCINRIPPVWDDAAFLTHSLKLYDAFCEHGLPGFYSQYLQTLSWKGPMIAVQAVPMFMTLGRSIRIAPLINAFYLLILSIYLYKLCRIFWNRHIAALAVLFTNFSPLLYGLSTRYLRDYSYAMLLTMTAWHLVKSDGLRKMKQNVILGLILGFGVLHRDIYPLYAFPLYLVAITPRLKRLGPSPQMGVEWIRFAVDCAKILGLAVIIAFPWYWVNWRTLFAHSYGAAFGADAKNYGSTDVFNWADVIKPYLMECMIHGISTWHLILLVLAAAGTVVALVRRRVRFGELFPLMGTALIVAWGLPFFVFLFSTNKDFRFISPIIPAFGILLAILVWGAMQAARWAGLVYGVLIVPSLWICLYSMFGVGAPGFIRRNQPINAYFVPKFYVAAADSTYWPLREMLRYIYDLDLSPKSEKTLVMTLNLTPTFNSDTLQLIATLDKLPFLIAAGNDTDLTRLRNWMKDMDYIVQNVGGETEVSWIPNPGPKVFQELLQEGHFVAVECPIRMPDGSTVRLWRRDHPMGSAIVNREWCAREGIAECEVKFPGVATLRGLSATFRNGHVIVQSVWAPETPFWRQYTLFMHALGADGKTAIYNGDHALQLDKLETYRYSPGALVYDCKVLNVGTDAKPTKVKLGMVRITDGNRAPIARSDRPLLEDNTAVLDDITTATVAGVALKPAAASRSTTSTAH